MNPLVVKAEAGEHWIWDLSAEPDKRWILEGGNEFQGIPRRGCASAIKDRRRSRKDPSVTGWNSLGRQIEKEVSRL